MQTEAGRRNELQRNCSRHIFIFWSLLHVTDGQNVKSTTTADAIVLNTMCHQIAVTNGDVLVVWMMCDPELDHGLVLVVVLVSVVVLLVALG